MNTHIETGTVNTPIIRGKQIGKCRVEAAYNYTTEKVILTAYSLVDERVIQDEFDHEEANARWLAMTGDCKPLIVYH
ncbi:hypothetical protein [uncultured Actinobacillus sp.]|uniref:hypothetical protein n=1 Tax=uncultured Actinobacillus sp. TaxID=417616 RepID=UPI0025D7A684|nr:hypothetical protein [uncultured Actinobacillus sp.]